MDYDRLTEYEKHIGVSRLAVGMSYSMNRKSS